MADRPPQAVSVSDSVISMHDDLDDLRRLAAAVTERRRVLGLTRGEVKDRGGPADTTMARIEQPTATTAPPRPSTLRHLDTALGWPDGTAASILAGSGLPTSGAAGAGPMNLSDALSFTTIAMPVDIIGDLVRIADTLITDTPSHASTKPTLDDLRGVIQRLTAVYATEVLERVGGPGVPIPTAIAVPFRSHLTPTADLSDDPELRREQLYRRWLAGVELPTADQHQVPDFEARWRAKRRDIMLRTTV